MSLTISTTTGTIIAATSSASGIQTSVSYNDAHTSATVSCGVSGHETVTSVEFLKTPSGKKFDNSFAIVVWWGGIGQEVLFSQSSGANVSGATWVCNGSGGSVTLTKNNSYSGQPTSVTVNAVSGSSSSTATVTDVMFSNYWISKKGYSDQVIAGNLNTSVGSWNTPATWPYGGSNDAWKHYLSWKRPNTDEKVLYYIVSVWKGYSGSGGIDSLGGLDIIEDNPYSSSISFTYQSGWSISDSYKIRYVVHAVFASHPAPVFDQRTENANRRSTNPSLADTYAIWRQGGDPGLTLRKLTYYEQDKSTVLLDSTLNPNTAYVPVGKPVYAVSDIRINQADVSSQYKVDYWLSSTGSSWGTTHLTPDGNGVLMNMPDSDLKLSQQLSPLTFTITFNRNGGNAPSIANTVVLLGTAYGSGTNGWPDTPTRNNSGGYSYAFKEWNTKSDGTGSKITSTTTMNTASNHSLYAIWTPSAIQYTITYNSNGGSSVSSQNYYVTTNLTLRAAPTRDGYSFDGWKCTATSGGWSATTYTASQNVGTGHYGNITLTAQWSTVSYTATFAPGSGTWSDNTTASKTSTYNITQTLSAPATISRVGYTFAGWKVTSAGGNWAANTVYNNSPQTKLEGASGKYGTVTFTAQWNINSYTLTTAVNSATMGSATGGGSKNYNASCTVVATPNAGYEFVRWTFTGAKTGTSTTASTTFNMPAGDVTATATFRARTFTLTFNLNTANCPPGLSDPSALNVTYNGTYPTLDTEHNNPAWDSAHDTGEWDYEFDDWYLGNSSTKYVAGQTYTTVGNQTWNAKWTKTHQRYTVVWKDYDDSIIETDENVEYGTTPTYDGPALNRPGYTWAGRTAGWTPVISSVTGNATYKAVYQIITYNITYHTAYTHSNPATYTVEDRIVLTNPTRTGYQFVRWTDNANATGENHIIPKGSTGNKNFWAWWVPVLSPFDPDPEKTPEEQEFFGIPVDIDPLYDYELKLSVAGDRGGMTNFVLPAAQGHYTTAGWENTIDKTIYGSQGLIEYLRANDVFTMDVWRAVIRHASAVLKVELNVYYNGTLIQAATPTLNTFKIGDQYKPIVFDAHFEEGMQSIYEMELFNESSARPRFIGNNKSCILCRLDATNYNSRNAEMLYGAVPTKFKVRLTSTQDSWMTDNLFSTISAEKVNQYITEANVETKQKIIYDDCDWIVVANEELFPSINQDIVATLKIKIFDTRHEG